MVKKDFCAGYDFDVKNFLDPVEWPKLLEMNKLGFAGMACNDGNLQVYGFTEGTLDGISFIGCSCK